MVKKSFRLNILKAIVLVRMGTDSVSVHTDLPSPFPAVSEQPLMLSFEVVKGSGVEYVREHFGVEPEVIQVSGV